MSQEPTHLPCGCSFAPTWEGHRKGCWYGDPALRKKLELAHQYHSGEIGKSGDIILLNCEEDWPSSRRVVISIDVDGVVWFHWAAPALRTNDAPIRGATTLAYKLVPQ